MKDRIKSCIDNLKHSPGVYLMYNNEDTIIYVGKAKDLFKRVSQYFLRPQEGKVMKMALEAEYFETIITSNEKEALVLEMNLIQKHYPKYNILLKDGSHYPYIALRKNGYPFLKIKRNFKDKNYEYFGPYPNSGAAYSLIDLLNKVYMTRKCQNIPNSPCLYFHLNMCLAPCINKIDKTLIESIKNDIRCFIKGDNNDVLFAMKNKMMDASEKLEFEKANEYKNIIESIKHINEKQNVEIFGRKDRDIFAFTSRNGYLSLAILLYRKGLLLGKDTFIVEEFSSNDEQVSDLILQYYSSHPLPKEIVINDQNVIDLLDGYLDCSIVSYSKGKLMELVASAKTNSANGLDQFFLTSKVDEDKISLLEELGELLSIKTPYYIELIDNSHLQGSSPVGALVAFINGEKVKSLYRKFKIQHEEARDDTKSMYEVIHRHFSRLKENNKKMCDLILLDGGLMQVKSGKKALDDLDISLPIYGLYKNDKHHTEGLIDSEANTFPINNKALFFMLTRMQDEVHRFAISFHKERRSKSLTSSFFDNIPGLGKHRKEMLYRTFSDINTLKNASFEELCQILPKDVAFVLHERIKIS